jgi:hypothetical protein
MKNKFKNLLACKCLQLYESNTLNVKPKYTIFLVFYGSGIVGRDFYVLHALGELIGCSRDKVIKETKVKILIHDNDFKDTRIDDVDAGRIADILCPFIQAWHAYAKEKAQSRFSLWDPKSFKQVLRKNFAELLLNQNYKESIRACIDRLEDGAVLPQHQRRFR